MLSHADQQALIRDLTEAAASGDLTRLLTCLADWQATIESLSDPAFMAAWRAAQHTGD